MKGVRTVEKEVKKFGTGAHVYLPREWVGLTVKVIPVKNPKKCPCGRIL